MESNIKNDNSYEDCIQEWKHRKKQLETIKSSKLPIAANASHYRLIQSAHDRACLKVIGYRF